MQVLSKFPPKPGSTSQYVALHANTCLSRTDPTNTLHQDITMTIITGRTRCTLISTGTQYTTMRLYAFAPITDRHVVHICTNLRNTNQNIINTCPFLTSDLRHRGTIAANNATHTTMRERGHFLEDLPLNRNRTLMRRCRRISKPRVYRCLCRRPIDLLCEVFLGREMDLFVEFSMSFMSRNRFYIIVLILR